MQNLKFEAWSSPSNHDRNDLVFENRNKSYGAYKLRNDYNDTVLRALVFTAIFFIGIFLVPHISTLMAKDMEDIKLDGGTIIELPPPTPDIDKIFKVEKKATTVEKLNLKLKNYYRQITDRPTDVDTLTMDDLNELKVSKVNNPDGKDDGDDDLFPDLGDLGKNKDLGVIDGNDDDKVFFGGIEIEPEFIGGELALMKFLKENLEFPYLAKKDDVSSRVSLEFIIEKDGSLSNIKVLKCTEPGYGFEDESIRVLGIMPNWKPGKQNGYPVRTRFIIPITYRLY